MTALNRLIAPLFERQLLPHSFAYRPGRGAWALLETYLHFGTARNFDWVDTGRGVAQGSPLSPLLSNIALAEFDRFLNDLPAEWVRYADNFILLAQDPTVVRDGFERAEAFLLERCGLRLNPESRRFAAESDGFEFLGFRFHDGRRTMTPNKLDQKRRKIAEILGRQSDLRRMVEEVSETVRGWRNYYGLSPDTRDQLISIERHLGDLLTPWLERRRRETKSLTAVELKAELLQLELPVTTEPRQKQKWVDLAVARSRPRSAEPGGGLSPAARRAVEQRKREYLKLKQEQQEILITKPGTYLGRTGERLLIRHDGKREAEIPLSLIRNITLLTKALSISGELMAEAAARGINIVLAGSDGRPTVRIGPPELAEHQKSLAQSALAASPAGLELARVIVAGKIRNQVNLLQYYSKYSERRMGSSFLTVAEPAMKDMEAIRKSVLEREFSADLDLERNRLFAAEGQAAASYWLAVRALLWWKPGFEGRVRRGANDLVNSLLNYGYGILYSRLLNVLTRSGLNIYIGFLHKPQPGKAGLLYDCVEEYRTVAVDRPVFAMLNRGVTAQLTGDGLDADTRRDLAHRVVRRLQAETRYHGESMPLEQVMDHQARLLVRHIEGKGRYQTFVLPW